MQTEWIKLNFYAYNPHQQINLIGIFVKSVRDHVSVIWDQQIVQKVQTMKNNSRSGSFEDNESNKSNKQNVV